MAFTKFLFQNQTEGFAQEAEDNVEVKLGKVVLTGGGIDMASKPLVNVPNPSNPLDAVNLQSLTSAVAAEAELRAAADAAAATASDAALAAAIAQEVLDRDAAILVEKLRAQGAESTLTTNLSTEASARASADTTLQSNIDSEAGARSSADTVLQGNIDAEEAARKAAVSAEAASRTTADTTLQGNIDAEAAARTAAVSAEAAARSAADIVLQGNIDTEASSRSAADTLLQSNLDAEEASRTAADALLQTNLDTEVTARIAAVLAEKTAREAADADLQSQLDTEEAARIAADSTLTTNLAAEVARALAAEAELQGNIDAEAAARIAADLLEQGDRAKAVSDEAKARADADTALGVRIDNEASARSAADSFIQSALDQEILDRAAAVSAEATRALAAELKLTQDLAQEVTDRGAAVAAEAAARDAADITLTNSLADEAAARVSGDTALGARIDSLSNGIQWKQSVRVATTENIDVTALVPGIDGLVQGDFAAGDRILVKNQTDASENGVYHVKVGGALARVSDSLPGTTMHGGDAVFVEAGTVNHDSGWVLITDGAIAAGQEVEWSQFTGLGDVVAGAGLQKAGNTISVLLSGTSGLSLAGDVLAVAPSTSKGISVDGTGVYVKLPTGTDQSLKFIGNEDPMNRGSIKVNVSGTGGINTTTTMGLALKLASSDELSSDVFGLHVVGVPAEFKLGGTAVGSTVDAANLTSLTDGSQISGLHSHEFSYELWNIASDPGKGRGLYVGSDDYATVGDSSLLANSHVIGVSGGMEGSKVKVMSSGVLPGAMAAEAGFSANERVYMGHSGQPVKFAALVSGDRVIQMGIAKNGTDMAVRVFDYGRKA